MLTDSKCARASALFISLCCLIPGVSVAQHISKVCPIAGSDGAVSGVQQGDSIEALGKRG